MADERPTEPKSEPRPAQAETRTVPPPGEQPTLAEGSPAAAVPPDLAQHPRYQIECCIGRGGMGMVFRARHRIMDRPVALKVMRSDLTGSSSAFDRFSREVKAAAALSHPNIVAAHDAEQAGELQFLVMEYVDGSDLAKVVAQRGPLPVAQACHFIFQAALGLQHAFEKGMIHRDIKPQNLMLLKDVPPGEQARYPFGQIKILDFGLARFAQTVGAETASGVLLGTIDFMAPEQANDARSADIRSDIYSLGCSLFYLLSGRSMFPDGTLIQRVMSHVEKPPPLNELRATVPPDLINILAKMLAKDPGRRYQTPAEVAAALSSFAGTAGPILPPVARLAATDEPLDVLPVLAVEAPTAAMTNPPEAKKKPRPTPAEPHGKPRRSRFLLGCFIVVMALIGSGTFLGYHLIRSLIDKAGNFIDKQVTDMRQQGEKWQEFEKSFVPPPDDAPADHLFPPQIGEYKRVSVDGKAAIPPLDVDLKGRHAEYRSEEDHIDIYVYKASKLEKEAMYGRVLKKLEMPKTPPGAFHRIEGNTKSSKLSFHVEQGAGGAKQRGALWWTRDRLFCILTPVSIEPEPLLIDYLEKVHAARKPAAPSVKASKKE